LKPIIWLVGGCSGAHYNEDFVEWVVAAYFDEEEAKQHAKKALERGSELYTKYDQHGRYGQNGTEANEYDSGMEGNEDLRYYTYAVDLLGTIPKL